MKKILLPLLCLTLLLALCACGKEAAEDAEKPDTQAEAQTDTVADAPAETPAAPMGGMAQIANPWSTVETMDAAKDKTGFALTVDAAPEGAEGEPTIRVMNTTMIELDYQVAGERLSVRKAAGSGDISGDYNTYAETADVTVGERSVTMKGADGTVSLATWTDGDYAYAVSAEGLSVGAMTALIEGIR